MCLIKDFDEIMLMSKRKAESNTIKETATTTATEKYKTSQRKIARDRDGEAEKEWTKTKSLHQ